MGSDGIVNVRGFNNSFNRKKKGNKQAKLKQNKVDVRKETKICQGAIPLANPPTNRNGNQGHGVEGNQATKHEHVLAKYNNGVACWMKNSTVRRSDEYSSYDGSCPSSCCEEGKDDCCLDDWEAMADALTLTEENNRQSSDFEFHPLKSEASRIEYRAWRTDDVFRPRSLPSINSESVYSDSYEAPTCPICCEDLDSTDWSFLPCPCGFKLCLFCHKTIIEVDGRCPGCRKLYDSVSVDQKICFTTKNSEFYDQGLNVFVIEVVPYMS